MITFNINKNQDETYHLTIHNSNLGLSWGHTCSKGELTVLVNEIRETIDSDNNSETDN